MWVNPDGSESQCVAYNVGLCQNNAFDPAIIKRHQSLRLRWCRRLDK
jgi:hypothetical protein